MQTRGARIARSEHTTRTEGHIKSPISSAQTKPVKLRGKALGRDPFTDIGVAVSITLFPSSESPQTKGRKNQLITIHEIQPESFRLQEQEEDLFKPTRLLRTK